MAPYHILIVTISLHDKQFHRHFGLKKCLILCTLYLLPVKMAVSFIFTPKTSLTGKICDGTISHINSHN